MITIEDAQTHLVSVPLEFPDETVAAVLAAEHAHQRSLVQVDGTRPAELDEALLRRVEVNLAATGGDPVTRGAGRDDQVRALEAPHARRRSAAQDETPPKNRGRQRRRTKKTAATKTAAPTPQKEIS